MRVAVLSAEAVPYSKTGGLGDVAGALPKALRSIGEDAFLITPLYKQTKENLIDHLAIDDLWIDWRGINYKAQVYYSEANGSPTFLIHAPEMFFRDSIYGYTEDYERFAFFNHAALILIKRIGSAPDIVHLNDWHCGFAAVEIAKLKRFDAYWRHTRTVFSIHNLAYQGVFGMEELWKLGFGDDFSQNAFLFNGAASAMKAGLADSDMLSTVSKRYGYEIQQTENGYGLDWLLRQRNDRLHGIVNGVDYDVWNRRPTRNFRRTLICITSTANGRANALFCKDSSYRENLDKPIFASVTRLTSQKGFDLIQQTVGEILATGAYFIALGSGDSRHEDFLQRLRDFAPAQVGVYKGYNEGLAHQIEAGADMFLMPSRFEPCGLNQMYSLRYGTIPIVRAVGGLDDTVENFDRVNGTGNGFKFHDFSSEAFLEKIYESLFAYYDQNAWRKLQWNGMTVDNSWENAARKYVSLYLMVNGKW